MIYTLSTLSTDLITNEGILDLFKNASWENLLFFVLFAVVIVFGVGRIAKPQKEQNQILNEFSKSIEKLVINTATEETSRDERHERYISEINSVKEIVNRGFDKTSVDLKEINDTLIRHNATRCVGERIIKEVSSHANEVK
jgi:hypothetical protein